MPRSSLFTDAELDKVHEDQADIDNARERFANAYLVKLAELETEDQVRELAREVLGFIEDELFSAPSPVGVALTALRRLVRP